ncbi:LLM class flavin-dependent oxidoreductase [Streptomyces sp. NBC_00063]|uniref:LLM class flavin-dependent oxidoreductase n=1 Tax=Streptomyces sp. NBC_00063 TaxID=2975638 RepID=UPI003D72FB8A
MPKGALADPRKNGSLLDLAPIRRGHSIGDALHRTVELAAHAERLGLHRYWLADHHNMSPMASSAHIILAGAVAAGTRSIRVGTGSLNLSNHTPSWSPTRSEPWTPYTPAASTSASAARPAPTRGRPQPSAAATAGADKSSAQVKALMADLGPYSPPAPLSHAAAPGLPHRDGHRCAPAPGAYE